MTLSSPEVAGGGVDRALIGLESWVEGCRVNAVKAPSPHYMSSQDFFLPVLSPAKAAVVQIQTKT